jgi:hypothetical protein
MMRWRRSESSEIKEGHDKKGSTVMWGRQAWQGRPNGIAGPRKLGLHIPRKLPPHILTRLWYTTVGEWTHCSVVWPHKCGGHIQCSVEEVDGPGWYSNISLGSWVCILKVLGPGWELGTSLGRWMWNLKVSWPRWELRTSLGSWTCYLKVPGPKWELQTSSRPTSEIYSCLMHHG